MNVNRTRVIGDAEREKDRERLNELLDSTIDLDQVIVFDAEILSKELATQNEFYPDSGIQRRLSRILNYAIKNSERVCEISDYINKMMCS